MSPPPEAAVITFRDDVLRGTDSVTVPPPVFAVTWYWAEPAGTMIVTSPPPVSTWTSRGTWVNTISMSPPLEWAVIWAAVIAVPWMLPPPVLRLRTPDTRSAVTSPPPVDSVTLPVVPTAVASPPPVDTDAAIRAGTLRVASRPQLPAGTMQRYPMATPPGMWRVLRSGRIRL